MASLFETIFWIKISRVEKWIWGYMCNFQYIIFKITTKITLGDMLWGLIYFYILYDLFLTFF